MAKQSEYLVTWEIDVTADSKVEAAKKALSMVADIQSTAHAFEVETKDACVGDMELIDLDDTKETGESFIHNGKPSGVEDVLHSMGYDLAKNSDKLKTLISKIHPDLLREYLGV